MGRDSSLKNEVNTRKAEGKFSATNSLRDITDSKVLIQNLEKARLTYKPGKIKCLIVAEAPPDGLDRFFYYEDVKRHDDLFLGITEALYPELKNEFIKSKRNPQLKEAILSKFKSDGFYLIDLSDLPITIYKDDLKKKLPHLKMKILNLVDKHTSIILIKANVYDLAYNYLSRNNLENVVDVRIPFPGQGSQKRFQEEFKKALSKAEFYNPENNLNI